MVEEQKMTEFTQGEMIEVSDDENFENSFEREFIAMTKNEKYLCWSLNKFNTSTWKYARPIENTRMVEFYKWEKLILDKQGYTIIETDYVDDEYAKYLRYKAEGFIKIESSKTTREVEI